MELDMDIKDGRGAAIVADARQEPYRPLWQERTALLLGDDALGRLRSSTVVVAGLGGVGAYAAEMTARAGVGRMIIIDSKVDVMAGRLLDINPELHIVKVPEYLTEDNISAVLDSALKEMASAGTVVRPDFVIDAIDTLSPKIALIAHCVHNGIPLVSSMGSGAKLDATKVRLADISKSYNCPLAFILRKRLRKIGISKGFQAVFSEELPEREAIVPTEGERNKKSQVGTVSYLPAVFGCICAQAAVRHLCGK